MHKLYAPVTYAGELYIAKVTVEEYGSAEHGKRFYNLRGIKIDPVGGNRNPNIVPVMIIQVTEAKWNRYMESGKTIGEMLNENDAEMPNALDVEKIKTTELLRRNLSHKRPLPILRILLSLTTV